MKRLFYSIMTIGILLSLNCFPAEAALKNTYGGTVGFAYQIVSTPATKTTSSDTKAKVLSDPTSFYYWFQVVDSNFTEKGYKYVMSSGVTYNLVDSNTVKGNSYTARAHREYPTETGYVQGTWQP